MTKEKTASTQSPAFEARLNHVRVTIWENVNKGTTYFNTVVTRRYKENEEWRESSTYSGIGDLALVAEAVNLAQIFIRERTMKSGEANTEIFEN